MRKQDTRFVDGKDFGHAALYGDKETFDAGVIDDDLQFHCRQAPSCHTSCAPNWNWAMPVISSGGQYKL